VELEQTHLQRVLEPLAAVDGRTVLTIGDDGLVATSVDDFMVTSVEAALHQSLCRGYEAAPGTIVIDAAALLDVLEAERDGDSLAELTYAPDGSTLTLSLPSFVHTQTVDVGVTVDRPDIDDSSDGVTTYHAREELAHAFEYFTDRSSVVALGYDETDDECYLEAVSTGEAAPKPLPDIIVRANNFRIRRRLNRYTRRSRPPDWVQSLTQLRQRRRSELITRSRTRFDLRGILLEEAVLARERSQRLRRCLPRVTSSIRIQKSELTPNSPPKRPLPILAIRPVSRDRVAPANVG